MLARSNISRLRFQNVGKSWPICASTCTWESWLSHDSSFFSMIIHFATRIYPLVNQINRESLSAVFHNASCEINRSPSSSDLIQDYKPFLSSLQKMQWWTDKAIPLRHHQSSLTSLKRFTISLYDARESYKYHQLFSTRKGPKVLPYPIENERGRLLNEV